MSAMGSKIFGFQPEISVVITTRNRLEWLKQCLASALTQSGADFEVIVVNDASEDGTGEWLDTLNKPRVSIFHNNTCAERSASRNLALAQARGACVMFLDDDDLLWPGALEALSDALRAHPEAVAAVGARQAWFVKERYRRREPHPRRKLVRNIFSEVLFGWCVTGGQALLRTEEVRRAGGFDLFLIPCEDRDLWQKLASTDSVAFIPDTVLTYRVHREYCLPPGRLALRERVARRAIAALPRESRRQALLIRRSRMWFDRSDDLLSSGQTWRGIRAACNGMATKPGLLFSPLIGEWVFRWLLGRGLRHYFPPRNIETEGADPLV
jgi:glycosyltransferase involved in cell wall biosynthesis